MVVKACKFIFICFSSRRRQLSETTSEDCIGSNQTDSSILLQTVTATESCCKGVLWSAVPIVATHNFDSQRGSIEETSSAKDLNHKEEDEELCSANTASSARILSEVFGSYQDIQRMAP